MSLRIYNRIWESSEARKGDLLVLLAIGDQARDCGFAALSLPVLASKARCSERQAVRAIARLSGSGELAERASGGQHKPKTYRVLVGGAEDGEPWCECIGTAACHGCQRGVRRAVPRDDKASSLNESRVDILSPLDARQGGHPVNPEPRQGRHLRQSRVDISCAHIKEAVTTDRKQREAPSPDPAASLNGDLERLLSLSFPSGQPTARAKAAVIDRVAEAVRRGATAQLLAWAVTSNKADEEKPWERIADAGRKAASVLRRVREAFAKTEAPFAGRTLADLAAWDPADLSLYPLDHPLRELAKEARSWRAQSVTWPTPLPLKP